MSKENSDNRAPVIHRAPACLIANKSALKMSTNPGYSNRIRISCPSLLLVFQILLFTRTVEQKEQDCCWCVYPWKKIRHGKAGAPNMMLMEIKAGVQKIS
jgi:hypothetical protein